MVDFNSIAKKWQENWEKANIFHVKESKNKKKYTVIEMYPYPSSQGLHMGHARNYTIGDCYARFKRMQGFNVLYPMGYDSFGLPAENAAIKEKTHPKRYTENAIKNFISQQKRLGLSYDWDRMLASHYPEYYKWNQWFFIKFYEKGLAYKKGAFVNWCNKCGTVLANEQVKDGKCWRCHSDVDKKNLEQWFLKITAYADELLKDIEKLEGWPERVRIMQENWIGKSHGVELTFKIVEENRKKTGKTISTYTTRVDTVYGITYLVLAAEHPMVLELSKGTKYEKEVQDFVEKTKKISVIERTAEGKPKNGVFLGVYFINPFTNEKCPLWVADYALYEYGTGAVMAVPTHDQRDFEFAKKYKLPMRVVISPNDYELNVEKMQRAFVENGIMINSADFNGMSNLDAIEEIADFAEKNRWGRRTINYKLRDWLISRQRYWGTPIPMIYCEKCGIVPVQEKELPVLLPEDVQFTGGGNPLAKSSSFVNTKCPKCKAPAKRETDTMDTFFDSCWYYLRYCDNKNKKMPFDKKKVSYWMPVDQYIGGVEHAVMHLLYARFFVKVLRDIGLVNIDEPFTKLFNQGMLHKGGAVMSKSLGNVVTQDEIEEKYGIDTARLFLLFVASPDKDMEWSDEGIEGSFRFLNRVYYLTDKKIIAKSSKPIENKIHKTIKNVTGQIEGFEFNKCIISLMEYVDYLYKQNEISKESLDVLALLLNPFVPHLSEEIWEKIGNKKFASLQKWPKYNPKKINAEIDASEELVEKTIYDIKSVLSLIKKENPGKITLIVSESWKYPFFEQLKKQLEETHNAGEIIGALMNTDFKKHGQDITKIVPSVLKDLSKIPNIVLTQKKEIEILDSSKKTIENEFKCSIEIIKAEDTKEQKAKQAMPGKVAIFVS